MSTGGGERRGIGRVAAPVPPRALAKVPFAELADGRLQGVVSSGSEIERVYVSSITAGTHAYYCSTNNNRPCGGLNAWAMCKHLQALVDAAALQYGVDRVARYLRADLGDGPASAADLMDALRGQQEKQPAATVFSGFLRHLGYLELPDVAGPVPELDWFPTERVVL
ncbi:hypothetical protein I6A84_43210 [Frankia sp. CNm7]|uniref:Uncharacterized protein n=1 Tax=Frankia nepalensis TaxID=1836974 RepID=A0A937RSG3_9ACTN|nr:hypothetical protein [Frankia nepalensis]MBL7511652.1 hypothetical protein [Frankia nepalensis]MBL7524675.1 hypothetical protein [Frankia nepalensis]MBL7631106.1 hypothetical protein [Frankia nepalensis]